MNRKRMTLVAIAIVCLLLALAIAGAAILLITKAEPGEGGKISGVPSTVSNSVAAEITIKDDGFIPKTITVKAGTPVKWTSRDDENNHSVISDPHPQHSDESSLKSELMRDDDVYSHTFEKPGTYKYHDEIHPELGGTVIVTQQ